MHGRNGFPDVIQTLAKVIRNMSQLPAGTALDMNNITMRIALDITGLVGFAKDFETCNTFKDADTDELFNIVKISKPGDPDLWLRMGGFVILGLVNGALYIAGVHCFAVMKPAFTVTPWCAQEHPTACCGHQILDIGAEASLCMTLQHSGSCTAGPPTRRASTYHGLGMLGRLSA